MYTQGKIRGSWDAIQTRSFHIPRIGSKNPVFTHGGPNDGAPIKLTKQKQKVIGTEPYTITSRRGVSVSVVSRRPKLSVCKGVV